MPEEIALNLEDEAAQGALLVYATELANTDSQKAAEIVKLVDEKRAEQGRKPMRIFYLPYPPESLTGNELGMLQAVFLCAANLLRQHNLTPDLVTPSGKVDFRFDRTGRAQKATLHITLEFGYEGY